MIARRTNSKEADAAWEQRMLKRETISTNLRNNRSGARTYINNLEGETRMGTVTGARERAKDPKRTSREITKDFDTLSQRNLFNGILVHCTRLAGSLTVDLC